MFDPELRSEDQIALHEARWLLPLPVDPSQVPASRDSPMLPALEAAALDGRPLLVLGARTASAWSIGPVELRVEGTPLALPRKEAPTLWLHRVRVVGELAPALGLHSPGGPKTTGWAE